jgi:hypothetical protein
MGEIKNNSTNLRTLDGLLGAGITDALAQAILAGGGTLEIDAGVAPKWSSMEVSVEGTKIIIKVS